MKGGDNGKTATWMEYWGVDRTGDTPIWLRYFEADGEPVLTGKLVQNGVQMNVLKFNPFVHSFSGFGKGSPEGKPESQAVGRLRFIRSILQEECALSSDIMSLIHRHAYGHRDFKRGLNSNVADNALDNYNESPHEYNLLPETVEPVPQTDMLASLPALFNQLSSVRARLDREAPSFMQGAPIGSSGRHADLTESRVSQQWDSVVDREQLAFSVALGQCLRIIDEQPGMLPVTVWATSAEDGQKIRKENKVTKDDIKGNYDCEIEMKASDAIQKDRDANMYKQAWAERLVTGETALIKGYGYTLSEAVEELDNVGVENITRLNPQWNESMSMIFAEMSGIPTAPWEQQGGKSPRPSEIKTQQGRMEADIAHQQGGVRQSPQEII